MAMTLALTRSGLRPLTTPLRPASRNRRVSWLLALVLLANFIDLFFTLSQRSNELFYEVNPFAHTLLDSVLLLVGFKLLLVVPACAVLLYFRRTTAAEIGCWCACAAYTVLLGHWYAYFQIV